MCYLFLVFGNVPQFLIIISCARASCRNGSDLVDDARAASPEAGFHTTGHGTQM